MLYYTVYNYGIYILRHQLLSLRIMDEISLKPSIIITSGAEFLVFPIVYNWQLSKVWRIFNYTIIYTKKCKEILTFFSRSTTAKHKLISAQKCINEQQEPLELIQDIDTRCNSTYEMFKRFFLLQTTLNMVLCEDNMSDNLDSVEWNCIIAITDVLKAIKDVTEKMSDKTYPTISQYYSMYFALINILQSQATATTLTNKRYEQ